MTDFDSGPECKQIRIRKRKVLSQNQNERSKVLKKILNDFLYNNKDIEKTSILEKF